MAKQHPALSNPAPQPQGGNRRLAHGEKTFAMFTSEKGRDRADARRQIEGLSQGDAMVALLQEQNDLLRHQGEMLRYLCDSAYRMQGADPEGR